VDRIPRWAVATLCLLILGMSAQMFGFRKRIPMWRIGFGGDHTDMRERDEEEARQDPTIFTREFIRRNTLHWFDHVPLGGYPYPPGADLDRARAQITEGRGEVLVEEDGPLRYRFKVGAEEPLLLRVNIYRFPGWTLRVDGEEAEPAPLSDRRPVMMARLPAGDHDVELTYERTPARWAGDLVSLGGWLTVAGLAAAGFRRGRPSGSGVSAES
jgi:hypothetical protein